ncbi:uncharacterized protein LOC122568385 [Bombus pyrosoma]|uniref:uncharacterized protein LOC122568385 n=1 Tax=Bombus pyrosoma TaxID=396416 RepID=UPI001CB8DE7F|nr:uncharacterized protein LOC122568385 [Bombus pyrosoma]
MRPRLVKINKKESPKSASCIREKQVSTEAILRQSKSKCEKTRTNIDATVEEKIAGWRLKKSVEIVQKKTRRTPKRVTATHNFVYEFNPFGNPTSASNNSTTAKGIRNLLNVGEGDSLFRHTNNTQNFTNVRPHTTAELPKLHSRSDTLRRNSAGHENITNYGKTANLPTIKKQEIGDELRLAKARNERRKLASKIDQEVEKVKSDWQALRSNSEWTQSKNFASDRTRKLYDTLEKMTQEIDKMQKSYLDPKSNQYLHRGAMKALDPPDLSFEEKAAKVKNMLFPKENKKIVDGTLNNLSNTLKGSLSGVVSSKDIPNKEMEKRSLLSNMQSQNVKNGTKLSNTLPSNLIKRNTSANNRKNLKKINSDTEQYLSNYISEAEKFFVNKEEPKIKELEIHPEDVSDILKKLNINSVDIFDIANNSEEDSPLQSVERMGSRQMQSSVQTIIDQKIGSEKVKEEGTTKISSLKEDDHLTEHNNVLNYDTSIQTNIKAIHRDNVFIEMGLHALNNNYPQNALMRVLQSEYLKKDRTLKPM